MAEREKLDDIMLRDCIQQAYGHTEEQLLREMEEAEQSLEDTEFSGASERMFKRIMEMEAASVEELPEDNETKKMSENVSETAPEVDGKAENAAVNGAAGKEVDGKKIVRFGKKKIAAVAVLVAVLVGMLGVTAIGEKSYFFRMQKSETGIVYDNSMNIDIMSSLEEAYKEVEKELEIKSIRLTYIPSEMKFSEISVKDGKAIISFDYKGNVVYLIQIKKDKDSSIAVESDREYDFEVENAWIGQRVECSENRLEDGSVEFEGKIVKETTIYFFSGKMEQEEFVKIIKNLNFY